MTVPHNKKRSSLQCRSLITFTACEGSGRPWAVKVIIFCSARTSFSFHHFHQHKTISSYCLLIFVVPVMIFLNLCYQNVLEPCFTIASVAFTKVDDKIYEAESDGKERLSSRHLRELNPGQASCRSPSYYPLDHVYPLHTQNVCIREIQNFSFFFYFIQSSFRVTPWSSRRSTLYMKR